MKKVLAIALTALALCAITAIGLASCGGDSGSKSISITIDAGGGSDIPMPEIKEGGTLPPEYLAGGASAPEREGYRFGGWLLNGSEPVTADTRLSEGDALTASWIRQVTVSFYLNYEGASDADTPASVVIDDGASLGALLPIEADRGQDWDFLGWFRDEAGMTGTTPISSDTGAVTLTAHWSPLLDIPEPPAIHPGSHFAEVYASTKGELSAKAGVPFTVTGLNSNIEQGAGTLSTQWYKADSEEGEGAAIGEAIPARDDSPHRISISLTWTENEPGVFWLYPVVTNYNPEKKDEQYSSATTMNRLKVTVTP